MAFDYVGMRDTADELITEFGAAMTLKRNTRAAYNPQTQTATLTPVNETGRGVLFPVDMSVEKGTDIRETDLTCWLSAKKSDGTLITLPLTGDALIAGGVTYRIVRVKPISPATLDVVYELIVRNG